MALVNFHVEKEKIDQIEMIQEAFRTNKGNFSAFVVEMIIKGFEEGSWTKHIPGGVPK